jgi:branched-chain amino acid aminotransferase
MVRHGTFFPLVTTEFSIKTLININGIISPPEEAKISIFDRGFLFGDSVYEVTLTHDGVPFLLEEHLDRLWLSASKLNMGFSFTRSELAEQIQKTVDALELSRIYLRIVITRGEGLLGLDPNLAGTNNLVIIAQELSENPSCWYEKGVEMIIADIVRNSKKSIDPSIKSGNYLNNVMAMSEAKQRGAFDAIMLNHKGQVTEATTSNIWMIKNGEVFTPPVKAGLLGGITRSKLIELASEHKISMSQENFTADQLKEADECFLSSTTKQLVPITKLDGAPIGDGKVGAITLKLLGIYRVFVGQYSTSSSKK